MVYHVVLISCMNITHKCTSILFGKDLNNSQICWLSDLQNWLSVQSTFLGETQIKRKKKISMESLETSKQCNKKSMLYSKRTRMFLLDSELKNTKIVWMFGNYNESNTVGMWLNQLINYYSTIINLYVWKFDTIKIVQYT